MKSGARAEQPITYRDPQDEIRRYSARASITFCGPTLICVLLFFSRDVIPWIDRLDWAFFGVVMICGIASFFHYRRLPIRVMPWHIIVCLCVNGVGMFMALGILGLEVLFPLRR